jgi:hypothetical protein
MAYDRGAGVTRSYPERRKNVTEQYEQPYYHHLGCTDTVMYLCP